MNKKCINSELVKSPTWQSIVEKMIYDEFGGIEIMFSDFMAKNNCRSDEIELFVEKKQDFTFETTIRRKEKKLNPCGCGGKAFVYLAMATHYKVRCTICDTQIQRESEKLAIGAWNAAMPMHGWKPIETAPNDGSFFTLRADGHFCLAWKDKNTGAITTDFGPTVANYWMPIPKIEG